MKKIAIAFLMLFATATFVAAGHEKSCDAKGKGEQITATGRVACQGDDCTFQTADAKTTYTVCEMSKADLPKLSASGATVTVRGKLITCEGKEQLLIQTVSE